jgi:hypothetical protein
MISGQTMQFRDEDFDVYVTEGALAIVHRGEHVSSAQMFGVDWDGPSHSVMHAAVFDGPAPDPLFARAHSQTPRLSAIRFLLDCVRREPSVWVCVGWTIAWIAFRAWK